MDLENIKLENLAEFLEERKKFEKRLRNETRNGLSDSFLKFLLNYYNSTEKYISELELENLRLVKENSDLIDKCIELKDVSLETLGWQQSMLIKQLRILSNEIGRNKKGRK